MRHHRPARDERAAVLRSAELELQPTSKLELSAGARYDLLRYIFEDFTTPALGDARTMNSVSPRLLGSYAYRPGHRIYAALSGGIEGPAFNEIDPPAPFDTQTGLNPFLRPAQLFAGRSARRELHLVALWSKREDDGWRRRRRHTRTRHRCRRRRRCRCCPMRS